MRNGSYRRVGFSRLGAVLKGSLDSLGLRQKVVEQQAAAKWAAVVGPQIAAVSRVDRITDGVMFVACKSSMWASELTLHANDILGKLEKELGKRVVKEIRFSARGFRKACEDAGGGEQEGKIETSGVRLSDEEKRAAAAAASAAKSEELAARIEKAVLACKMREKVLRRSGKQRRP